MELHEIYGREYHRGTYKAQSAIRDDFSIVESVAGRFFRIINSLWQPQSIIEIGCSSGAMLEPFREAGIEVFGVDGDYTAFLDGIRADIPEEFFQVHDLREPYHPPKKYGVCLCIETLEHIEPEFASVAVDSICRCSDRLFITAAAPGQGGIGHVNLLPIGKWAAQFRERGFRRKRRTRLPEEIRGWPTLLVMER
jgi:hypothetical protein